MTLNIFLSPPTIIAKVPFSAPIVPPETGASKKNTFFFFKALPISKKVQELYAKTVKSGRANLDHSALYLFIKALSR